MPEASKKIAIDSFRRSFLLASTFVERAYRALDNLEGDEFRMRVGNGTKALVEEVLAIAAFLKHFEIPSRYVRCRLAPANQDYDAQIQVSGTEVDHDYFQPGYYLEVTSAISPTDYLEREALSRNGFVFGGGDIRREASRHRGDSRIVSNAKAVDGFAAVENVARWILTRIATKEQKHYPSPCFLLLNVCPERRFTIHEWSEVVRRANNTQPSAFAARFIVHWEMNTVFAI